MYPVHALTKEKQAFTPEQINIVLNMVASQRTKQLQTAQTSQTTPKYSKKPQIKHIAFAQIGRNVLRGKGMFSGVKMSVRGIISALIDYCGERGECFLSLENLAKEIGSSDSTLFRWIPILVDKKILIGEKQKYGTESHEIWRLKVNEKLIWDDNEKLYGKPLEFPTFIDEESEGSFQNDDDFVSNWDDMAEADRAQTAKLHFKMTSELDTITLDTKDTKRVVVGKRETSPSHNDFYKNDVEEKKPEGKPEEKKEYSPLVLSVAKELHLPPTAVMEHAITAFTTKYPRLDQVAAANNAYWYSVTEEKKISMKLFITTCNTWAKWKKFTLPDPSSPAVDPEHSSPLRSPTPDSSTSSSSPHKPKSGKRDHRVYTPTIRKMLELYPEFEYLDNEALFFLSDEEIDAYGRGLDWRLLATTHYLLTQERIDTEEEALARKKEIRDRELAAMNANL